MKSRVGSCAGSASWEQPRFTGWVFREAGCGELPCVTCDSQVCLLPLAVRHGLQAGRVPRGSGPPLPGRFSRSSLWNLLLVLPSSLRPSHAMSACSVGLLTREGIWGVPGERRVQASGSCVSVSLGQVLGRRAAGLGFLPFQPRPLLLASALLPGLRALLRREAKAFLGARTALSAGQPFPATPAACSCPPRLPGQYLVLHLLSLRRHPVCSLPARVRVSRQLAAGFPPVNECQPSRGGVNGATRCQKSEQQGLPAQDYQVRSTWSFLPLEVVPEVPISVFLGV